MAKAIQRIERMPNQEQLERDKKLNETLDQVAVNHESVMEGLRLLQLLQDRNILPLLNGALKERDEILSVLVPVLTKKENTDVIKNLLEMISVIRMLDMKGLKEGMSFLNTGLEEAKEGIEKEDSTSILNLLKSLKDPNVNKSITFMMNFLKGMGKSL
jgi:uncharacterized protein YjgD (DUF1641 family)